MSILHIIVQRLLEVILEKIEILLGLNSSEIKLRHIRQIGRVANLPLNNLSVVDGGANVGEFTDVILRFQARANVLCIEPQEKMVQVLKSKFRESNVQISPIGLGTSRSIVPLYFQEEGDRKASLSNQRPNQNFQLISIQTLSEALKVNGLSTLNILKLDLEGMDVPVLQSYFQHCIQPLPEVIILEVSYLANFYGFTPSKTFELLTRNGYKDIFRTSPLFNLIRIRSRDLKDYQGHTTNWVAVRS
jgi:FkbM family methyltransferase